MNLKLPAGLLNATRLVRRGKLMEATAAIQRVLGAGVSPVHNERSDSAVIEGTAERVDEALAIGLRVRPTARERSSVARAPRRGPRFVTGLYSNKAGALEYKTYLPARDDVGALPLVVMLHGCKQNPDDFATGTRMNELAEEHGFVVVYPKQALKSNVSHCWNWFQPTHQQRDQGEPSLIAGITRKVIDEYGLDERRVYVAGLSAGGAMAMVMGTLYPDLYSAVGIHSGLAYGVAGDVPSAFAAMRGEGSHRGKHKQGGDARPGCAVRTIVFHGDRDTTVHPSNGKHVVTQVSPPSSAQALDAGAAPDDAIVETGVASGRTYTKTTYRDETGQPWIEHWLVHGAGHAWSGGSTAGSYSDSKGPDASREMIRFFLER